MPLSRLLSRLRLSRGRPTHWPQNTLRRWLVLQQSDNPSTDYYIRPRLLETGLPVSYRNIDRDSPHFGDLAPGTGVVIVRYLNTRWARALRTHRGQLSKVAYFMDDDLLHPKHWAGLPRAYVKKLKKHCGAFIPDIYALTSDYWFSTEELRQRYSFDSTEVMAPRPLLGDTHAPSMRYPVHERGPVQMFYHGSATHQAEMEWLFPIIKSLLDKCTDLHFELIGNHAINQKFRHLPRTRILHPLSWHNYVSHCHTLHGHIGLAPILPSPFNMGRSHSKIYDIARCGAVGVYSTPSPYVDTITDRQDGLLLKNDPDLWMATIYDLVNDRARLNALRFAAIEKHVTPAVRSTAAPERTLQVARA